MAWVICDYFDAASNNQKAGGDIITSNNQNSGGDIITRGVETFGPLLKSSGHRDIPQIGER